MERFGMTLVAVGIGLAALATVFVIYVLPLLQKFQTGMCKAFGC